MLTRRLRPPHCCLCRPQRAVQTARGAAKPLLPTLLQSVGDLFAATQQAACLDMLATVTEVFGEVRNAPDVAAAQQQALEGAWRGNTGRGLQTRARVLARVWSVESGATQSAARVR